jgi:hypothetical protein
VHRGPTFESVFESMTDFDFAPAGHQGVQAGISVFVWAHSELVSADADGIWKQVLGGLGPESFGNEGVLGNEEGDAIGKPPDGVRSGDGPAKAGWRGFRPVSTLPSASVLGGC